MTVPESVPASSLPLVNQECDSKHEAQVQDDQGDGSDGVSSFVSAETASASVTEQELRDWQGMAKLEKDIGEGKKRDDVPAAGSAPLTVKQSLGENIVSDKNDLVVSGGVCDHCLCIGHCCLFQ